MHQRKNQVQIQTSTRRLEPMGDQRYQQLLKGLGALFAQTEDGAEDKKLAAIADIKVQMAELGLSTADLAD